MSDAAPQKPKLLVYDHCPFCARVRVLLGLKNIDHELVFLANEDEATPIGLVGAKQVPILVLPSGKAITESLDVVRYLDENYGGGAILNEASGRADLADWVKRAGDVFTPLVVPRNGDAPFPEFARRVSREYYRAKKEKSVGPFTELLAKTPELVEKANALLKELEELLHSTTSVNEQLSYDDIDVVTRLRGITIVKGIQWPPKTRAYLDHFAQAGDLGLFERFAV